MLKSELLEREAEARRIQLEETFDELRARVTPGHVLDQLVDYASDSGGGDFFRNLKDQTVANPLALGLVGAGLAWLMLSNGREPRHGYGVSSRGRIRSYVAGAREGVGNAMTGAAVGARDRLVDAAHRASEAAGSVGATARTTRNAALETASNWRDAAGSAASSLRDTASSGYEQARSRVSGTTAALGDAASAVYGGVAHSAGLTAAGMRTFARGAAITSQDMLDFCREQPLVLAGLGIALGAAVGAVLPSTETEDQLMGETSDELKEQTRAFANVQYDKSRPTAEAVLDEVQHKIKESIQPLTGQPSIVPLGSDAEIGELKESDRSEPIGSRDSHR